MLGMLIASTIYLLLFNFVDERDGRLKRLFAKQFKKKIIGICDDNNVSPLHPARKGIVTVASRFRSHATKGIDPYEEDVRLNRFSVIDDDDDHKEKENENVVANMAKVVVVNAMEQRTPVTLHGPMKFTNNELNDLYLYVKPLTIKDADALGNDSPFEIKANYYRKDWDKIKEYTLGTLYYKYNPYCNIGYTGDHYRNFRIELKKDEKTGEFITLEE